MPLTRLRSLVVSGLAVTTLYVLLYSQQDNIRPLGGAFGDSDRSHTHSPYVRGPPTESFRDNLLPDVRYITAMPENGLTNSIMSYMTFLYLAYLTGRVAVLPPIGALHIGRDEPWMSISAAYDLAALSADARVPIIEWEDVKELDPLGRPLENVEEIGCWSTHIPIIGRPIYTYMEDRLGLDIAFTSVPKRALMMDNQPAQWINLHLLYALDFNRTRSMFLERSDIPQYASRRHGNTMPPDEHLMCFDFIYEAGAAMHWEWDYEWTPAWTFIGRHMRFNQRVEARTKVALHRAFGIPRSESLPPYIAIHVRHGDFAEPCINDGHPLAECLAPLSAYARRVREVQDELLATRGISATRVLMTSDERDPAWWAQVSARGWAHIDFAAEEEDAALGKWYPIAADSAAQAMAQGFVGTVRSTVSMIAARRVYDWNGGAVRMVNWGYAGADDEYVWHGTSSLV